MGSYIRNLMLNIFFWLLIVTDFFVISNLMTAITGPQLLLASFSNVVFVGVMDILPIFILTPALNKILKGVVTKETDARDYNTKVTSIWLSTLLFFGVVIVYFTLSVYNPERFLSMAADASNVSEYDKFLAQATAVLKDNSRLLSIIFGLLPVVTTLLSCLCNFLNIGNRYIEDEIKKCNDTLDKCNKSMQAVESAMTVLHNLEVEKEAVLNYIGKFQENIDDTLRKSVQREQVLFEQADIQLKSDVLRRFQEARRSGTDVFETNHLKQRPSFGKWINFISKAEVEIRKGINL